MSWGTLLVIAVGALLVALGFAVRAGRARSFFVMYRTSAPAWIRNASLAFIPAGVAPGAVAFSNADMNAAGGLLTVVTLVALVIVMWWLFKPPESMKPGWLQNSESGAAPGLEPTVA